MRRASGVKVSATRNVCAFCAHRFPGQTRQLHSSSNAPQYAAEAQVYKEERGPAKPLTQAEKMQQLLRQQFAAKQAQQAQRPQQPPHQQPPPRPGYPSQAERTRAALHSQQPSRPPPSQHAQRHPPQRTNSSSFFDRPPQSRYKVNMESRPPMAEAPQFGATGHLRRRNDVPARNDGAPPVRKLDFGASEQRQTFGAREPQRSPFGAGVAGSPFGAREQIPLRSQSQAEPSKPRVIRPKLDQDELARLLGTGSTTTRREPPKSYAPLSRDTQTRSQPTCFNCGQKGHMNYECPEKSAFRPPPRMSQQSQQSQTPRSAEESVADAAEAWIRQKGKDFEGSSVSEQSRATERKNIDISDRRRARFNLGEDLSAVETRNRYEEPERRQRTSHARGARGRVMRDEDVDEDDKQIVRAERKRARKEAKKAAQLERAAPIPISIPAYISVANLAGLLRLRVEDFVVKLEQLGFEEVQNDHILNAEHAGLIAQEYNFEPIIQTEGQDGDLYPAEALSEEDYVKLPTRPPVVTIMGHVDHGKTTILDYMRSTSVAATEFGGITQHIGAFSVALSSGKKITFLDTPGHAAFETMRARGANVTDIVVLVVAADDSVMPQTVEAIKHAQAAKVPIIVAINKIDKQQADPDRVKLDLGRHGLEVEEFGGDIQTVCLSGKTGQGISDLEDAIALQSEILDHRADPETSVEGWVLEGTTKKSGRVATVLVRSGTLHQGDILVAGTTWTRVRTLRNEAGITVDSVGPGMPVEVDGWREQPIAGDVVLQALSEQQATEVSSLRTEKVERMQMAKDMEAINTARRLEAERKEAEEEAARAEKAGEEAALAAEVKNEGPEVVNFIIKADVSGSAEAVLDSVTAIGNNEISPRILRTGVGSPSEFDVQHAADAKGHIINFNTSVSPNIMALAEEKGVRILESNIIYRVVDDVKALLSERLPPKITQRVTGEAEIAAVFEIGVGGKRKLKVAGSRVRNGVVGKGVRAKVLRGEEVVFDGVVSSLKNHKKDVETVRKDNECGISFEGWEDFKVGDKVQCYDEKSEKRSL